MSRYELIGVGGDSYDGFSYEIVSLVATTRDAAIEEGRAKSHDMRESSMRIVEVIENVDTDAVEWQTADDVWGAQRNAAREAEDAERALLLYAELKKRFEPAF